MHNCVSYVLQTLFTMLAVVSKQTLTNTDYKETLLRLCMCVIVFKECFFNLFIYTNSYGLFSIPENGLLS